LSVLKIPLKIYNERLVPDYLGLDSSQLIEQLLYGISKHEGEIIKAKDFTKLIQQYFSDPKYYYIIERTIEYFYSLVKLDLNDVLQKEKKIFSDLWDLKKRFYKWVQENFLGYIPQNARDIALERFAKTYGLRKNELDLILSIDKEGLRKLKKVRECTVIDFIGLANYIIMEKILTNALEIKVSLESEKIGSIIKELLYRAKKMGISAEIKGGKGVARIYITGPKQLFKMPTATDIGRRICYIILPSIFQSSKWEINAIISIGNKEYLYRIRSDSHWVPFLKAPWEISSESIPKTVYDSKAEEIIHQKLTRIFKDVYRESKFVKLHDGTIFIPDFVIIYNNQEILLEVIGFWTDHYIKKKIEKLDKLWKEGRHKVILLVDSKLMDKITTKFPIIYFDKNYDFPEKELKRKLDILLY